MVTKSCCAAKPPSTSEPNRRTSPPSRRLKPLPPPVPPPPPESPRMLTPLTSVGGAVGSNTDQPWVWHRAQFISKRIWPSLTFLRDACHFNDHWYAALSLSTVRAAVRNVPHVTACAFVCALGLGLFSASAVIGLHAAVSCASVAL